MMTTTKKFSQLTTVPKPVIFKYIILEESKSKKHEKSLLPSSEEKKSKGATKSKENNSNESDNQDGASVEGNEEMDKHVFVYSSDMI